VNQIWGFGAFILGAAILALCIAGIFSWACIAAALLIAPIFLAVLMLGIFSDIERTHEK